MKRRDRFERMSVVYREYLAASVASEVLDDRLRSEPERLTEIGLNARDFRNFRDHLSGTYLIRLFSEFEAGLRDLWTDGFSQSTVPRTRDLLLGIAARRLINQKAYEGADSVRIYRNSLVHEGKPDLDELTLKDARRRLSQYFSYIPLDW